MTEEKMLSQTEVNELLGKTRIEARDRATREFETKLAKEREDAEKARLAENQEFKLLAEKLQSQVDGQVGLAEQVEKYQEIMKAVLANAVEGLSDEVKSAVDSLPGDTEEKLAWLNENKTLFTTSHGDGVGTPKSSPKTKKEVTSRYPLKGI